MGGGAQGVARGEGAGGLVGEHEDVRDGLQAMGREAVEAQDGARGQGDRLQGGVDDDEVGVALQGQQAGQIAERADAGDALGERAAGDGQVLHDELPKQVVPEDHAGGPAGGDAGGAGEQHMVGECLEAVVQGAAAVHQEEDVAFAERDLCRLGGGGGGRRGGGEGGGRNSGWPFGGGGLGRTALEPLQRKRRRRRSKRRRGGRIGRGSGGTRSREAKSS